MQAYGFRNFFTPLRGVLFTFPSRYWFTIGLSRVFSLSGWSRKIHTGFHVTRATQDSAIIVSVYPYRAFTFCGASFRMLPVQRYNKYRGPTTPQMPQGHLRFRLFPVRSPLLGESLIYFLFLRVLRCFSSPRSPRILMYALTAIQTAGLSHSETRGSKVTCTSSRIIAACHVLLRL